jgi:hypothetical protein
MSRYIEGLRTALPYRYAAQGGGSFTIDTRLMIDDDTNVARAFAVVENVLNELWAAGMKPERLFVTERFYRRLMLDADTMMWSINEQGIQPALFGVNIAGVVSDEEYERMMGER